jgi:hypothetical protein
MLFSKKLKCQSGILKQRTEICGILFRENDLIALTGYYDKIYDKSKKGRKIIVVEVIVGFERTNVDIEIFKNARALKRLIP